MPFDIIRIRRDTLANWTSVNPTLALGEISYDLTNHEIRVGDGTSAWLDLPTIGNAAIANGDKGDIVVTGGGTTWTLDPSIVATINNKLDQGPLDGGNATTGDQVIQVRRDTTVGWTTSGTILGNGEMGYDSTLVELRIGNGVDIWENLDPIGINKAGSTNLVMLADVDYPLSSPADGEVLTFDIATDNWINKALPAVSLGLNDLTNVTLTSPSNTQILQFNGTEWVNAPAPTSAGGTLTSGSKNHINVINTASDWQINNNVITQDMLNLQMPTNPEDASTKGYTDSIVGLAISANVTEELDQANGIAVLNSSRVVSTNRLGSGIASSSNFLRGDNSWAVPVVNTSTISQGSATIGEVITWSDDLSSWQPVPITAGDGISLTYDDLVPEHIVGLNTRSTQKGQNYVHTGVSWANVSMIPTADTVEILDTNGSSKGNWKEQAVDDSSGLHSEWFDYSSGDLVATIPSTSNFRVWIRQEKEYSPAGDEPTQSMIDNDFIQTWTGKVDQSAPECFFVVGFQRTHSQDDISDSSVSNSVHRIIGFRNVSGNVWRASVWREISTTAHVTPSEETFGFTTTASIFDEHTLQVVVCNSGTTAKFYVDGVLVGTANNVLPVTLNGVPPKCFSGFVVRQTAAVTGTTPTIFRTKKLTCVKYALNSILSDKIAPGRLTQAGATTGQVLKWNGTNWAPDTDSGGGGGVSDHGALTGLADDDHTQYHNDARGDARYSQLGHSHTLNDLSDVVLDTPLNGQALVFSVSQWVNQDLSTVFAPAEHVHLLGEIEIPALQKVSGRLLWWNNDATQLRTVTVNGSGLVSVSHDNTLNTFTITVPSSHSHTLSNITDAGTMASQNASSVSITGGTISGATVTTGTYNSPLNQAVMKLVRNNTGSTIAKGKVVRITGSLGDNLTVALADATDESTSSSTIGITAESIADSADGFIITQGVLTNLTGIDTPFVNGDLLWLSETAGEFTRTRPTAPAHGVVVGWVMSTSAGSAGRIYVKIDNGYELNELHNVSIPSTPADKDLLAWDNSTGVWKNMTKTTAGFGTLATLNTVGTSEITALAVTNPKLANNSITPVKLSNQSTTNSLVGFDDTGVGDYYTAGSGIVIDGSTMTISATASGGAPVGATYIVQTSDGTLTNAQALGSLATGILKNTTSTGVLSIATGSDLPSHTHAAADITSGVIATARLGSGTADTTTFLRGDGS